MSKKVAYENALALVPDAKEFDAQSLETLEFAKEVRITDDSQYAVVGDFMLGIKALVKKIESSFDTPIRKQSEALKSLRDWRDSFINPLKDAERICKDKIVAYKLECDRKREEEEKRLRAEATKREEAEKKSRVEKLVAQGKAAQANALATVPVQAPPIVLESTLPKLKGVSFPKTWDFRIEDASLVPREFLIVDETKVRAVVKSMGKDAEKVIPGVVVFESTGVAGRSR